MRFPWVWSLVLALCSCNGDCVAIAGPAFVVDVTDVRSGALLAAGSTLIARGAAGADSVSYPDHVGPLRTITLVEGRLPAGMYTVEVRRDGYVTWVRSGITLRDTGDCGHVRAVHLLAELEPLP
jgi:hypothetical protein